MAASNSKQHLSNEQLLGAYQQADADCFNEFFDRNRRLVFNYLLSRLGNRADAEEALQRTFLRIHRYILTYDPSRSALGWTFAIARNVLVDTHCKRAREFEGESTVEQVCEDVSLAVEARESLHKLLDLLSPEDRVLVLQRYLDEKEFDEIARDRGLTPANVRQKISRAIRRLRLEMFPV